MRKAIKPSEATPAFVPEAICEPRAYLTTIANGLVVSHIRPLHCRRQAVPRTACSKAWAENRTTTRT